MHGEMCVKACVLLMSCMLGLRHPFCFGLIWIACLLTLAISCLLDPTTRDYANFRVSSDGELQGVGLLIANEPVNNHLLVLAPIKGGPADRAGMMAGDEVRGSAGASCRIWTIQPC